MQTTARTTVASFHYAGGQFPAYQSIAVSFLAELEARAESSFSAVWTDERFLTIHLDGARISLAYRERADGERPDLPAAIALAVDAGNAPASPETDAPRRGICALLAGRLGAMAPAETEIWIETDRFTPGSAGPLLQRVTDPGPPAITGRSLDDIARAARARALRAMSAPAEGLRPAHADRPALPDVLPAAVPGSQPAFAPANDLPQLPGPMLEEAAQIRSALYEPLDLPTPTRQRVALYAMSLTLCAVAGPVGGALLTYNALGRENLRLTARVMSITGGALLVAQSLGLMQLVQA